jgi:O-acetylserine/cysteine efflux transporter
MPVRDRLLAVLVALLWGFNFVVMKAGVTEVEPLLLLALRFGLAAVPAVFLIPRPNVSWGLLWAFAASFAVVKFGLLFVALKSGMPSGLASLVLQVHVFFTVILAAVLLSERPSSQQIAGLMIAACGLVVIADGEVAAAGAVGHVNLVPFVMVVGAALSWAFANIVVKRAGAVDMLGFTVWASLLATPVLIVASLLFEGPQRIWASLAQPSWTAIGATVYLAYPVTIIGVVVWNDLLKRQRAANVAPYALLVPVVGLAASHVVYGEPLTGFRLWGGLLIGAGLLLNSVPGPWARRAASS